MYINEFYKMKDTDMLKIAICDDDNKICSEIEKVILNYQNNVDNNIDIDVFYSGESLIEFIKKEHSFDLIFLDIELKTTTGIEVGRKIREELEDHISKIVFITSKTGYEIQLFDLQPLNFIKKPIDEIKVRKCIDLTIKLFGIENKVFQYKKDHEIIKIKLKEIIYFEKVGRKTKIVTDKKEDFFNESISKIKERLPKNFVEPHCSFIVNFDRIIKLHNEFLIMTNDKDIPISQRNLKNIRTMLINFEMEK